MKIKDDQILDVDSYQDFQEYLWNQEEILWESKPKPPFNITILEFSGEYDVMLGMVNAFSIVLGLSLFVIITFYLDSNWFGFTIGILCSILLMILPDILKRIRRKKTKYAFSENRIFFKLWYLWKTEFHYLDFSEIAKITYEAYEKKNGVIHFMLKSKTKFNTYDFQTGEKRFHPTFEMIPDVINVRNKMEALRRKKSNNKKAISPMPKINP